MGNFIRYICDDTEFLDILNQIEKIERQFYVINRNSRISIQLEKKFESLIEKLKNPNEKDINKFIIMKKCFKKITSN